MNAMQMLSSEARVERLVWTLVHFLWQGLAICFLYAVARKLMSRESSPNGRYVLACAALTTMMAAPLATWHLMRQAASLVIPARRATCVEPMEALRSQ